MGRWCHNEIIFIPIGQYFFIFGRTYSNRFFDLLMNWGFRSCVLILLHYCCVFSTFDALMWPFNDAIDSTQLFSVHHQWLLLRVLSPVEGKLFKPYCAQRVVKRTRIMRLFTLVSRKYTLRLCHSSQTRSILFRMGYKRQIKLKRRTADLICFKHFDLNPFIFLDWKQLPRASTEDMYFNCSLFKL